MTIFHPRWTKTLELIIVRIDITSSRSPSVVKNAKGHRDRIRDHVSAYGGLVIIVAHSRSSPPKPIVWGWEWGFAASAFPLKSQNEITSGNDYYPIGNVKFAEYVCTCNTTWLQNVILRHMATELIAKSIALAALVCLLGCREYGHMVRVVYMLKGEIETSRFLLF
jgi:hypothetical protein